MFVWRYFNEKWREQVLRERRDLDKEQLSAIATLQNAPSTPFHHDNPTRHSIAAEISGRPRCCVAYQKPREYLRARGLGLSVTRIYVHHSSHPQPNACQCTGKTCSRRRFFDWTPHVSPAHRRRRSGRVFVLGNW